MTIDSPLRLYGQYGSPYTRKMLSLLRYRRIPYQLLQGGPGEAPRDLPRPKVNLLPTFYLTNEAGELEAVVDSTPLIRRLDLAIAPRSVIPEDPAVRFIDYLLEDYADEWLTKAMFHYRWAYKADSDKACTILPMQGAPSLPEQNREQVQQIFRERQVSRLHVVGSNETTGEVIENSYRSFLQAFESLLHRRPFLLGDRPAAADFAIYGQLSQLACFDPTPMQETIETAPRVCAWANYMEDLSGLEIDEPAWSERAVLLNTLKPLLTEVGRGYVPVMLANAQALANGDQSVQTTVQGKPWQQNPFPYQGHCLKWVREQYTALAERDRQWVSALLSGTGCEALLQD